MIATWMAYLVAISVILGLAALALESASNAMSRPTRWAWALAFVVVVATPAIPLLRAPPSEPPVPESALNGAAVSTMRSAGSPMASAIRKLDAANRPLALAWIGGALATLLILGVSAWRIRRQTSRWIPGRVAGVDVRYSVSSGPAVVGCFPGTIVLPRWSRALSDDWQSMMVTHEQEHVRAQDTGLIAAALVITAAVPWNPFMWWMFKRLKHAVELDCDRRVIQRGIDPRAYGTLLVELTHRAQRGPIPAAAFAAPEPLLTRRIRLMTMSTHRTKRLRAICGALLATAIVAIGCEIPLPPEADHTEDQARIRAADLEAQLHAAKAQLVEAEQALSSGDVETTREARQHMEKALHLIRTTERALEEATYGARAEAESDAVSLDAIREHQLTTERLSRLRKIDGDESIGPAPLVYVDGVRIERDMASIDARRELEVYLSTLSPDEIERVEVIKGAAAEASYGADGANGVIRVTTKTRDANRN